MTTRVCQPAFAVLSGLSLILLPSLSFAGNPVELTAQQLDRVTAGVFVLGSSDAQATGVIAITNTQGRSLVLTGASPNPQQPGFATTGGAVVQTALSQGTNLGQQGAPPPSSATSVTTNGGASGNFVVKNTVNSTTYGAGGVVFQVGYTAVFGQWIGF